jgi:hypothetical protein
LARTAGATSSAPSTRKHHATVGAVSGAVLGAAAGIVGSGFLGVGCTVDPCHATRTRVGFAIWFGSLGGVAGGVFGAAVGALLPVSSEHQQARSGGDTITVSFEPPPINLGAVSLRAAIGDLQVELPAPAAGSPRAERSVQTPASGPVPVHVALLRGVDDTLAAVAFSQSFARGGQNWISATISLQRPVGSCVGRVEAVPLRSGRGDTLFVMHGSVPAGATC